MFQRILVPLDGTEGAERAIPVAARIARATGGAIVQIETDVASGATSPTIFSAARDAHVDLLVMCSHGETGLKRWVLGSVAHEAVRHSPVPVLVLHEHGKTIPVPDAAHPLRVLVPLDGSTLAERALKPVAQLLAALAAPAQGEVHLLCVVDLPPAYGHMKSQAHITDSMQEEARKEAQTYVQAVADRLRETSFAEAFQLNVTSSVAVSTDVAGTITGLAEPAGDAERSAGSDLIAMATHGHGGLRHLALGSVTERVLDATLLPLLIVRPQQEQLTPMVSEPAQREIEVR
jgi:nucleotide-binding universal stress UspA family protein